MKNKPVLLCYFGGKYRLAPKLIPLFPQHDCYVEVFGGAAHVLLQKTRSPVEVYNDIDSNIYTLFKVLRNEKAFEKFYEMCELTPYSREQHKACFDMLNSDKPLSEVEQAWCFYTCINQGFGGKYGNAWGFSLKANRTTAPFRNSINKLPLIVDRLRDVQVENRDFEFVLTTYDSDDTFFYLDPPYLPETRRGDGYLNEMSYEDHERLIDILKNIQGKVMLSGYPNDLYGALGWETKTFDTVSCVANSRKFDKGNKDPRIEQIWYNHDLPQLSLFD